MKNLKLKDLVLEHYRKVYETEMDGVTVRVWKPMMMGLLPRHAMLSELKFRVDDAKLYPEMVHQNKVQWLLGNPDYGTWDAQIVRRFDPRKMELDIYFAAILVRPFSKQAYDWYEAHSMVCNPVARLTLMWDSRIFDITYGLDTSYGAYQNQDEVDKYMYSGKRFDVFESIDDPKFDPNIFTVVEGEDEDEDEDEGEDVDDNIRRKCVKLRIADNGEIETNAIFGKGDNMVDPETNHIKGLFHDCTKNFDDFRKDHPEVTEMHFYTDDVVRMEE